MSNYDGLTPSIDYFYRIIRFSLSVLKGLTESTVTGNDTVYISLDPGILDSVPEGASFRIPSYQWMSRKINELERQIGSSPGLATSPVVNLLTESSVIREPDSIGTLSVPDTFHSKPNWTYENFLNPYLYVNVDVGNYVSPGTQAIEGKRYIFQLESDSDKSWFENSIKNRNDINLEDLENVLSSRGIKYNIDQDIYRLQPSQLQSTGSFDVLNFQLDLIPNDVYAIVRKYTLNKLTYTDSEDGVKDGRTLKVGDVLVSTSGKTAFVIVGIDYNESTVDLGLDSGFETISVGVDKFKVGSTVQQSKQFAIGVGFSEYQVMFFRSVDPFYHSISINWSPGIGLFTNELLIQTDDGEKTFEEFYLSNVSDIGLYLKGLEFEGSIPRIYGIKPDKPVLNASDLRVVRVNNQQFTGNSTDAINSALKDKTLLEHKLDSTNSLIGKTEEAIKVAANDTAKANLEADLDNYLSQRSTILSKINGIIDTLKVYSKDSFSGEVVEKYRIRGFWAIPEDKVQTKTGPQKVIQFKIAYRYLDENGNSVNVSAHSFDDSAGTQKAYFSDWTEILGPVRAKSINEITGKIEWVAENVQDLGTVNINQLDIPITPGEKVEVRVKAISEAGYPLSPLESEWSDSVIVNFPETLKVSSIQTKVLQDIQTESVKNQLDQGIAAMQSKLDIATTRISSLEEDKLVLLRRIADLEGLINKYIKGEVPLWLLKNYIMDEDVTSDAIRIAPNVDSFTVQVNWTGATADTYDGIVTIQVSNDQVAWTDLHIVNVDSASNFADPDIVAVIEKYNYIRTIYEKNSITDGVLSVVLSY